MGEELGCVAGDRVPAVVTAQHPALPSPLSAWPAPALYGHSGSYRVKPVIAATPQEAGCMVPPVVTEIAAGVLTGL